MPRRLSGWSNPGPQASRGCASPPISGPSPHPSRCRVMSAPSRHGRALLPSVDKILHSPPAAVLVEEYGRRPVRDAVREVLALHRSSGESAAIETVIGECAARLQRLMRPSQRRVFNLTGTVLHTNLGRATLPEE